MLLGIIPLSIFLVEHMIVNHFVVESPTAFGEAARFMESLPFLHILEWVVIFIPLLFHALMGLWLFNRSRFNSIQYSNFRNWMFTLQRVTAIIAFLFIGMHIFQMKIDLAGKVMSAQTVSQAFDNPVMVLVYLIGAISVIFHFSNGIVTALIKLGVLMTTKSQKVATICAGAIFFSLSFIAIRVIFTFADL